MSERIGGSSGLLSGTMGSSRVLSAVGMAVLCAAVLELLGPTWVAFGPIALGPVPALVAGGILLGPATVVGAVAGYVGYHAVHGTLVPWETLGFLSFGLVGWYCWSSFGDTDADPPVLRSAGGMARFAAVTVVGALWGAGIVGWGHELTGQASFFPTAPFFAAAVALPATVFGALAASASVLLRDPIGTPPFPRRETAHGPMAATVLVVPVAWVVLGSLASIAFQMIGLVPSFHLRVRDLSALLVFNDAGTFGPGGVAVQAALGTVCLVLLAAVLRRRLRATAG